MKTALRVAVPIFAAALVTSGCTTQPGGKTMLGTLLGAGAGAAIGSQIGSGKGQLAAVAVGTLLGAAIGHELGAALDEQDRRLAQQAEVRAHSAPIGEAISWNNPDSGHYGSVTPINEGTSDVSGDYCREYQTDIVVGGRTESGYGTACRRADGSWEIVG